MTRTIRAFIRSESGTAAIEYGLVAALISVAIITVLGTLGVNLRDKIMDTAVALGPN